MKVYIAGPMSGLPDFNYPAFNTAAEELRAKGHEPLNPVDIEKRNDTDTHQPWGWYIRHAIRMVIDADAVAMLPGWENSKGARLEHAIATALELDIHPVWWWTT
jgi:Domain of unknown function (DUF4406)